MEMITSFWETGRNFTKTQWLSILRSSNGDEFKLTVIYTGILFLSVYWSIGLLYTFFDLTGILKSYKIQPSKRPIDGFRIYQVIIQVLFNQTLVSLPTAIIFFKLMEYRGYTFNTELPSLGRFLLDLIVCIMMEEITFYYFHRMFHHPLLYNRYHKQHHEWTTPIAITAEYCHPFEQILMNLLPAFTGPLLMGSHLLTCWIWFASAVFAVLVSHSGYRFPFLPSPEFHDTHHIKCCCNFGALGILDYFHGTQKGNDSPCAKPNFLRPKTAGKKKT